MGDTSFNDRDQPIESQVCGPNGELISRLTRSYDAKGRVIESAHVIESFESLLPPATREQLESDPNALEKMQAELAEFLGDEKVLARMSYIYDGRVSRSHGCSDECRNEPTASFSVAATYRFAPTSTVNG